MVSDSKFYGEQDDLLPVTPMSLVMNRLQRFRNGITSPWQEISPVTYPNIKYFLETSAHTSSNKPLPFNNGIKSIASNQQQIIPRLVTPMMICKIKHPTHKILCMMSSFFRYKPPNKLLKSLMRVRKRNMNTIKCFVKLKKWEIKKNRRDKLLSLNSEIFVNGKPIKKQSEDWWMIQVVIPSKIFIVHQIL